MAGRDTSISSRKKALPRHDSAPDGSRITGPTTLWQLFAAFFRIGILTFGGGYAMLPMFRRECVQHYGWVSDEEMLDLYAISQCTPGIIAVNAATYIGFKERRTRGAIASTLGVVTPSIIIICLIASILKRLIDYPLVHHAFGGIRIAVSALLVNTVILLMRKGIKNISGAIIFLAALALAVFTPVPLVLIVLAAGLAGYILWYLQGRKEPAEKDGEGGGS